MAISSPCFALISQICIFHGRWSRGLVQPWFSNHISNNHQCQEHEAGWDQAFKYRRPLKLMLRRLSFTEKPSHGVPGRTPALKHRKHVSTAPSDPLTTIPVLNIGAGPGMIFMVSLWAQADPSNTKLIKLLMRPAWISLRTLTRWIETIVGHSPRARQAKLVIRFQMPSLNAEIPALAEVDPDIEELKKEC